VDVWLGIDVGSVSTNLVLLDEAERVVAREYLRTRGQPIAAVQEGLARIAKAAEAKGGAVIRGVGTTGSARELAGAMVGADVVKNEITAHAVAALKVRPDVRTVLEIGGQDSKIIILRGGVAVDFAMNSVCAAGTGAFLDEQAQRLGLPIEEFGAYALRATTRVRIAGRCGVFAGSDMIHKQQLGFSREDIIAGLCEALVRNYLNNVGKGKKILPPVLFQGGVAANVGMKAAFERALEVEVTVPEHYDVMGAIGAALLAREAAPEQTRFRGFGEARLEYAAGSFECGGCSNQCEIVEIKREGALVARWGGRCGKWEQT